MQAFSANMLAAQKHDRKVSLKDLTESAFVTRTNWVLFYGGIESAGIICPPAELLRFLNSKHPTSLYQLIRELVSKHISVQMQTFQNFSLPKWFRGA